jgi:dipeptidase D
VARRIGDDPYNGLQPAGLWRHFAALNGIPRGSGNEGAAREYVRSIAESAGADFSVDESGNALVRAPSRSNAPAGPPIAVQTHLDMVCVAAAGVEHDFERDTIAVRRDGDRISAQGTTLGADNGIGVAAALALLTEPDLACGPLELIFTVEEEIGLIGALHFDTSVLQANSLINLDSEDDRALTVGCAGGSEIVLRLGLEQENLAAGWSCAELRVSGLSGGHSGVQIHEHRANAVKLLVTLLERAIGGGGDMRLISMTGGSAHNAIPSDAVARFAVPPDLMARMASIVSEATLELEREWGEDEQGIAIELKPIESPPSSAASPAASAKLLTLLRELPHGVIAMSSRFEDTVAASANLALVRTENETVEALTSIRALSADELDATASRVKQLGEKVGAEIAEKGGYPGWEPRADSPLVASAAAAYERIHGRDPAIEVVHGGLECGVLVAHDPELDAVSFGPLIREPHTPQEHVYASTVATTWSLLLALV